jgi:hypothetical protein
LFAKLGKRFMMKVGGVNFVGKVSGYKWKFRFNGQDMITVQVGYKAMTQISLQPPHEVFVLLKL